MDYREQIIKLFSVDSKNTCEAYYARSAHIATQGIKVGYLSDFIPSHLRLTTHPVDYITPNDDDASFQIHVIAANAGSWKSMARLIGIYSHRISDKAHSTLTGRQVLYYGHFSLPDVNQQNFCSMYILGKELHGYDELWYDAGNPMQPSIDIYLTGCHAVRRSALQTVCALRSLVGRDIARIIGRFVYDQREEVNEVICVSKSTLGL